jgi:hypothetical protein
MRSTPIAVTLRDVTNFFFLIYGHRYRDLRISLNGPLESTSYTAYH